MPKKLPKASEAAPATTGPAFYTPQHIPSVPLFDHSSQLVHLPWQHPGSLSPKQQTSLKQQQQQRQQLPLFWQLPTSFLKVFLRIRTPHFNTTESNEEYDRHITLTMQPRERLPPLLFAATTTTKSAPRPDLLYVLALLLGQHGVDETMKQQQRIPFPLLTLRNWPVY